MTLDQLAILRADLARVLEELADIRERMARMERQMRADATGLEGRGA